MAEKQTVKINIENERSDAENRIVDDEQTPSIDKAVTENDGVSNPLEDLEKKVGALEQESKDNYDRFMRISAEFENYKKRAARESQDFKKYANETLLKALLPVVDNLESAIRSASPNDTTTKSISEGVELTMKELLNTLEKFGVEQIDCLEKPFDPTYHQAVMQEESDDQPENLVLRELQKGYLYNDRLLRPTMVVVSKAKEANTGETLKKNDA
jgi:molecular chaperone GrpE